MLVNVVGTLALLPIMVQSLGDYWFGIWMLIGAIVMQYHAFDFGMSQTVVRFLSKHRADGDEEGACRVFSTTIVAFLALGLLTLLIVAAALVAISVLVDDPIRRDTLLAVVALLGFTASMAFPTYVYEGSIAATLRQDIGSILLLMRASIRIALTYFALRAGYGIVTVALIAVFTDTVYRIALWFLQRRIYPELKFVRSLVSWKYFKEMLKFGRFVFLSNISKFSITHSSVIIVSSLIGVTANATYAIALNVITRLEGLIRLGFFVTMPAFTDIAVRSADHRILRERFFVVTRVVAFGVSLIGGGLIVAGHEFITAWIGPDYTDAYLPLLILMSAWMFDLVQVPALQLMTALGKHKRFAYYDFGIACCSVAAASALAIPYGIVGVAFGVGLPVAVGAVALKSRNVCRELEIPLPYYFGQVGRVMLGSFAFQVPVWFLLQDMPPMNLGELFLFGCITYGAIAVPILLIIMPRSDQIYLAGLLPLRVRRLVWQILPHLRPPAGKGAA